jgi:hypothetical protein
LQTVQTGEKEAGEFSPQDAGAGEPSQFRKVSIQV